MELTFHGAAGCVTGSCTVVDTGQAKVLVDCGMFQGSKSLKALNHGDFPFQPAEIGAVLLTHAHIDHSGLLPRLVRGGFRGPIFATGPTRELCEIMLADSADIQQSDVAHLNRRNQRRGLPEVEPIYTAADVEPTLRLFQRARFGDLVEVAAGIRARFWPAGHLLGAASVEIEAQAAERPLRLLFSGDLGVEGQPLLQRPDGPTGVDHVILESTYGDRARVDLDQAGRRARLAEEMRLARDAGGPLLMPTFAIGRAQELLLDVLAVMEAQPDLAGEVFLDSPLAIEATDIYLRRGWNADAGDNPYLPLRHAPRLHMLLRPQESDGLDRLRDWHVILAGSGMCDAGRIRKHLKRLLWRQETTLLITGFQAAGTLGRTLQEGADWVRIQGDDVKVRARVRSLDCYSGHADAEALADWLAARAPVAGRVFLNHGEPTALKALAERIAGRGLAPGGVAIPRLDETWRLEATTASACTRCPPRLDPDAAARPDWHNARAGFLSSLDEVLRRLPDDAGREALLARLSGTVAEAR
ncbi:MAG: MBL fold metallo-hydrolase RNA specificity domain-containing protein [Pseudomonadota bacterium]